MAEDREQLFDFARKMEKDDEMTKKMAPLPHEFGFDFSSFYNEARKGGELAPADTKGGVNGSTGKASLVGVAGSAAHTLMKLKKHVGSLLGCS